MSVQLKLSRPARPLGSRRTRRGCRSNHLTHKRTACYKTWHLLPSSKLLNL